MKDIQSLLKKMQAQKSQNVSPHCTSKQQFYLFIYFLFPVPTL